MPKMAMPKSNPVPLCYLCFLLFNFSLVASVGTPMRPTAWTPNGIPCNLIPDSLETFASFCQRTGPSVAIRLFHKWRHNGQAATASAVTRYDRARYSC
jgi:hypothetical protein